MKAKATHIHTDRITLSESEFVDIAIWQVPEALRGSQHHYKYRLAFVINDTCALRYDNEAGKGDHKHIGADEVPYTFTTLEQLNTDFWADVARLRG